MSDAVRCPFCGSEDIATAEEVASIVMPCAPPGQYLAVVNTCRDCGERGDFAKRNDVRIVAARKQLRRESASNILRGLSDHGITMAYIERAFDLPKRTLARWKAGKFSASATALLRTVKTYPWIVEVADEDYAESFAAHRLMMACQQQWGAAVATPGAQSFVVLTTSANERIMAAGVRFPTSPADTETVISSSGVSDGEANSLVGATAVADLVRRI